MYLTPKLLFAVEMHVIMLVYCHAQEDLILSSFQLKESPEQLTLGKDARQVSYFTFEKDIFPKTISSNGHKTYQHVGRNNRRCKGIFCIDFPERSRRRHHRKKEKTYHNRNAYRKYIKAHDSLKTSLNPEKAIKSYTFPSSPAASKEWSQILSNDHMLSNFTSVKNTSIGKVINSNNDSEASTETKLNTPDIERDIFSDSNKQKSPDSEVLSARNALSNFFPNRVSGSNKNFVGNNQLNQTEEKSESLDESIKQILQNENLSLYFHLGKINEDADRAKHSVSENQLLTRSLNKTINYKHSVGDFDQKRNNSENISGELRSIMEEKTEEKIPLSEKTKSNKVERRSKPITNPAPGIQYRTKPELMENVVINKKYNSSNKDDLLSKIGFGNAIKRQINFQPKRLPSLASFLRQTDQSTETEESLATDRQCYSVSDLLMVVLITSLANLFAGFIITLTMCCISPRLRLLSSFRRTTESFSIGTSHSRLNMSEEEISGNVGCLEACLPDISYQRHVARDKKSKVPSRKLNSCFHHFQARRKGATLYQPGRQRYSSLHKADQSPLVARKSLSLEDLRVT